MNTRWIHLMLVVSLCLPFTKSYTQETNRNTFGIEFITGIPNGAFQNYSPNLKPGVRFQYAYQVSKNIPLSIGADFSWMSNGFRITEYDLVTQLYQNEVLIDEFVIPITFQTANNILATHLTARYTSSFNRWNTFVEALGGIHHFSTNTALLNYTEGSNFNNENNNWSNIYRHSNSTAFSYGLAGGVAFVLNEVVSINARVSYLAGEELSYFSRSDIRSWNYQLIEPDSPSAGQVGVPVPNVSKTDMFTGSAGLTFTF